MNRYVYINDTGKPQGIHAASDITDKHVLQPAELIIVEIPENTVPYIKVWASVVLLSHIDIEVLVELAK